MKRMIMTACLTVQALLVGTAMAAEPVGQVISMVGQATVTRTDGQAQELVLKSDLYLNDRVDTKGDTKLQIMLVDDAIVSLGANSSMKIDEFVYSAEEHKESATTLAFLKGAFRVITAKVADMNPERFKVKSNMATVGIRGCELCFNIGEESETVQIVRLPETKWIRFDSLLGHDSIDVRQQGVSVEIGASGFIQRPTTEAEVDSIVIATTPPVSGDGLADVVGAGIRTLGENPLSADAAEVDAGVDVSDSGVVLDSREKVNHEGRIEVVRRIVDAVVERDATSADAQVDNGAVELSVSKAVQEADTPAPVVERTVEVVEPVATTRHLNEPVDPGVGTDPIPTFPQEGTPIQKASSSGSGWSWGMWEKTDVLDADGGTRVSYTTQLTQDAVTTGGMDALINGGVVVLSGSVMAAAGLQEGNQGALLTPDGGANVFVLTGGGGGFPSWSGDFSLGNASGDQLTFGALGLVFTDGTFYEQASSYSLTAFGKSYGQGSLTMNSVSGTLVGGAVVSGAAGQFGFEHGSGPSVHGVFGVDLN